MTTEIIIKAHCSDDKEVEIKVRDGEEILKTSLQDGESTELYAYDDRTITVREKEKDEAEKWAPVLNSAEAVYGFAAWLTSREEKTVMSSSDDSAHIADLVIMFIEENSLGDVSEKWPSHLIHPSGRVAIEGEGSNN